MSNETFDQPLEMNNIIVIIDRLASNGISGWACNKSLRDKRVMIEILVDEESAGFAIADNFRPDLKELGVSDGFSGFDFKFPTTYFDGNTHEIIIRDSETGETITQSPITVAFPKSLSSREALGVFEHIDASLFVSGWAALTKQPDKPVTIDVLVDGALAVSQDTHLVRPDLLVAGLGAAGRHGFRIKIPKSVITALKHDVTLLAFGTPLDGGPKTLDLSSGAVLKLTGISDGYAHIELAGWLGIKMAANMFVDGVLAGQVDLCLKKNQSEIVHQGKWKIPDGYRDGQLHVYQAITLSSEQSLHSDTIVERASKYSMHVDHADFRVIAGWALHHNHHRPLKIGAYFEGRLVGKGEAVLPRADVQSAFNLATARCGFEVILSEDIQAPSAEFELRDEEAGIVLADVAVAYKYEALSSWALHFARDGSSADRGALKAVLAPMVSRSNEDIAFRFSGMPQRRSAPKPREIDVVIPVYGGHMETADCLESVLAASNETPSRIIVINDCSPDPLIRDYLYSLDRRGRRDLLIIHRTANGGFSEAVNIGMIVAGGRDVILLNADTVVQDGWIDRLAAAAAQDARIGTITPLSNNGEITTIPYMCKSLPVESPALALAVDQAAAKCNPGQLIDIPVGIGFCLYLRRECIDQIGLFDAATWGRGYGEEVDFCLKAVANGWRNVLIADTFVVHRGGVSFGDEKLQRIMLSAKKISERYPFYDHIIQRFLAADPVRPVRRTINVEMIASVLPVKRILHVTHAFGGGTEQYVEDMAKMAHAEKIAPIILRFKENGDAELSVDLSDHHFNGFYAEHHTEYYKRGEIEVLWKDIQRLNVDKIHVHAPFGLPSAMLDQIMSAYPFDLTVHDYAWICPRVTLTGPDGRYCGEPSIAQCNACVSLYEPHPGLKRFVEAVDGDIGAYREVFARFLGAAQTVFTGTRDVIDRLATYRFKANFKAGPHPVPAGSPFRERRLVPTSDEAGIVKVALIGALSDIKGFHHLMACAELAEKKRLPLHFIVFGYTMNDEALRGLSNVTVIGSYEEDALEELVERHRPSMAFFPNQWPETFSYTLSHAFRLGLWPVATDIGAPAERIRETGFGSLLPLDLSSDDTLRYLLNVAVELRSRPVILPEVEYPTTLRSYTGNQEYLVSEDAITDAVCVPTS